MGKYNAKDMKDYEPDTPLDEGWYTWRIINQKEDLAKKPADDPNSMLIVTFSCVDGPEQKNGKSCVGYETTAYFLLTYRGMSEKGKHFVQKTLASLITSAGQSVKKGFDWDELIDVELEGYAKKEAFEGEVSSKISRLRPITEDDYSSEEDDDE